MGAAEKAAAEIAGAHRNDSAVVSGENAKTPQHL